MARRNEHSLEEIRAMVLDAAKTIIVNDGYSTLTVRKIAKEMGYTVGSVYMVFAGMTDLVTHIKADTVDDLIAQLQQLPACAPERHIAEWAKTYLQFAVRNFNRWSMIFVHDAAISEGCQQQINRISSPVEAQFALLAPNCSTQQSRQAARALWSGIHGICSLSLSNELDAEDINDVEHAVVLLVECFIGGWVKTLSTT